MLPEDQEKSQDDVVVPLTAEQVRQLRQRQPLLSVWRVIGVQLLVGLLMASLAGWVFDFSVALSVLYGCAAVVFPAALFARGLTSKMASVNAGSAVFGFFLWEMVKIGFTVVMLIVATRWIKDLSWPAMLAGLVVTMKVYWVALGARRMFYPIRLT